jgi:hypothetical protein
MTGFSNLAGQELEKMRLSQPFTLDYGDMQFPTFD